MLATTFTFCSSQTALGQDSVEPSFRVATLNVPAIAPAPSVEGSEVQTQDPEAAARMKAALAHEINAEFFNTPLGDVLNDLSTQSKIPIILDQAATNRLKYRIHSQLTVTVFEAPVIFKAQSLPLANVLDLILPGLGLTWGTKTNETISVTTPEVADNWVEGRLYPVEQILAKNAESVTDSRIGARVIANFLTSFVAPESWQINGGTGEIVPLDGALLVRATRSVHEEARQFLNTWSQPQLRQPRPTAAEQEIRRVLAEDIVFDAPEQALFEVLPDMADQTLIPIVLDFYALLEERIPYDRPVGFNVSGASLAAVLDLMLDPQGLTAIVHKDTLLITTKTRAARLMSTRMYDVRELLVPRDAESTAPIDRRTLTTIIDTTVQPESWFATGGEARKEFYVSDNATEVLLFVRQTDAGHRDLHERLQQLKRWARTE
ncbi:MAG: hypothetical protein MPJ50_09770 [Pirellulales bacterium]|nr:hypothetical protein [Pirellulales bacterium]